MACFRYFPDGNGDTIRMWDDDGNFGSKERNRAPNIHRMPSKEGDVMICSYPRAGSHWVWEITYMLLKGKTDVTSLSMDEHHTFMGNLDKMAAMEAPRVLATHRHFHDLPSEFIVNKRKLVFVLRDLRDCCVSYYNLLRKIGDVQYSGRFDGFIELFLQGRVPCNSYSRWALSFEKGLKEHPDIPYHVIHFENLKQDPAREIARLSEFLGCGESLVQTVAEKTQFSAMKAAKMKGDDPLAEEFQGNSANDAFFRKGSTGEWQDWFTKDQASHFENVIKQQLNRDSMAPLF